MNLIEIVDYKYREMCQSIFNVLIEDFFERVSSLYASHLILTDGINIIDNYLSLNFNVTTLPSSFENEFVFDKSVLTLKNNQKVLLLFKNGIDFNKQNIELLLMTYEVNKIYIVLPHQRSKYRLNQRYIIDKILINGLINKCSDVSIEPIYNKDLGYKYVYKYREGIYTGKLQDEFNITNDLIENIVQDMLENRSTSTYKSSKVFVETDIKFRLKDSLFHLRCEVYRTIFGLGITIRYLSQINPYRIRTLGFNGETELDLYSLINIPSGLTLISGVVGCGKGTTVNAIALEIVSRGEYRCASIDMPTEYLGEYMQIEPQSSKALVEACNALKKADINFVFLNEIVTQDVALAVYDLVVSGIHVITTVHSNRVYRIMYKLKQLLGDLYLDIIPYINLISYQDKFSNPCYCVEQVDKNYYQGYKEYSNEYYLLEFLGLNYIKQPIGCHKCNYTGINKNGIQIVSEHIFFSSQLKNDLLSLDIHKQTQLLNKYISERKSLEEVYKEKLVDGSILINEVASKIDTWRIN